MRRTLHLLLVLAVLCCGLHLAPAEAAENFGNGIAAEHHEGDRGGNDSDHDSPTIDHAFHNHCPIAVDGEHGPALGIFPIGTALFVHPVRMLTSHSLAPPIEPPAT